MHKKISLFCKYLHIHRFLYIFRAVINLYIWKPLNRLQPRSLSLPSLFFQCIIYDVPSRSTCTYIFFGGGRTPPPTNKQTTCNIVAHSLSSLNYFCLLPRWLGSPEHSNTITIRIYLQKSVLPVYIYHLQRVMLPFTCQTDGARPHLVRPSTIPGSAGRRPHEAGFLRATRWAIAMHLWLCPGPPGTANRWVFW